ncbi:bucentaur or craniofacial development-domain-containing protein [Chytridium lagenaria]|nr:bucentaur or craniofacial development-domain-containing protein [Chytridium lagenaria]
MNSASTPKAKPRPRVVQTYKFAGEEFRYLSHRDQNCKVNPETPTTTTSIQDITHPLSAAATSSSVSSSPLSSDSPSTPDATSTPSTSKKITQRKSVLQDIATRYGVGKAAAKLNTLDKSKLDWMKHVEAAGDGDRLKRHNKDGHLEKMDFLNRAHDRQLRILGI